MRLPCRGPAPGAPPPRGVQSATRKARAVSWKWPVAISLALAGMLALPGSIFPGQVFPGTATVVAAESLDDPVEAGRAAMRNGGFPWYDAQADELKRIDVKPPPPPKPPAQPWNWDWGWDFSGVNAFLDSLGMLVRVLIYLVFAGILALLIYLLVKVFLKREKDRDEEEEEEEDELLGDMTRVEELPIQIAAPRGDFLAEARRRYEAGDYSGAIVYLFSYQLLHLDRHQRIQLTKGKTNRQYLREVRAIPRLQQMLGRTMVAFEDVFFGHHSLERDRFEACWREVEEFQRLTPQGAAT